MTVNNDPPTDSGACSPKAGQAKKVYEPPIIVPLGELVKGSGNCTSGSNPLGGGGNCKAGGNADVNNCISGAQPNKTCNMGGIPK